MGPRLRFLFLVFVVVFAAWIFVPVPALTATVPPLSRPAAEPGLPWLSVRDGRIVDDAGRTVLLRGFNAGSLLESTMYPVALDATDLSVMQQSGFDVVRLPIAWSELEPQRGRFDDAYLDRIAAMVRELNVHGMYVVLDMHSLGWSPAYGGSGAPAWATLPYVPDIHFGPVSTIGWLLSPAINASTTYFWISRDWQSELLATWRHVAARFRDDSGVAGYDVFNEPHALPLPPLRFDKDEVFPFYARAIDAIAAVDPNHLFFLDNDFAGDIPTWVVPIRAPNLVYAVHFYTGSLVPPLFTGDPLPLSVHVKELAREAAQLPGALWVGEFSIDPARSGAPAWIRAALDNFEAHGAGWAWWQWREIGVWGVRDAQGKFKDQLLRLLARPYVQAAPVGVISHHPGTPETTLQVDVKQTAGGSVVVAWPRYTAGTPQVRSSCSVPYTWDAATARLVIDVPTGSTCSVELTSGR